MQNGQFFEARLRPGYHFRVSNGRICVFVLTNFEVKPWRVMNLSDSAAGRSVSQGYGKIALKSSVWSFLGSISKQGSQFLVSLVLAWFLSPESFGLIGMVTLATGFALAISEMGLGGAIIQKQNATELDTHSLFWFNLALGTSLAVVLTILSPLIAVFFNKPELTSLIMGSSPVLFFGAVSVIPAALMRKALRFRALTMIEISSSIFAGVAAITMAFFGMGVWALVAQALLLSLSGAVLLYFSSGYRARVMVSVEAVRSFLPFSLNLLGFNLVNYLSRNVDYLLIGKFLGATPLGLYTLAYKIMLVPLQNISWALGNSLFPVFSKFSNDRNRVFRNYTKVISFISAITFPAMAFIHVYSKEIISIFYNEDWLLAGEILKVLSICGMIQSVISPAGIVFMAMGRTEIQFKLGFISLVATAAVVGIALPWGIKGVAVSYSALTFVWYFVVTKCLAQITCGKFKELFNSLFLGAVGFFLVLLVSYLLRGITEPSYYFSIFISGICALFVILVSLKLLHLKYGNVKL